MKTSYSPDAVLRTVKRSASILGVSIALASASQFASADCEYLVTNQWGSGFTGAIRITNSTSAPINGWSVSWEYNSGNSMTNAWNANVSGSGPYTATNLGWNGTLQPGDSVQFGFQGTASGTVETPVITGSICSGSPVSSSSEASVSSVSSAESSSSISSAVSSVVVPSSSSVSSVASSAASSADCEEVCQWYSDTPRPLCNNQASGWGWENQLSCIGRETCASQDPSSGGGIVSNCAAPGSASSAVSSSSVSSVSSSSSSVVVSSSSSSVSSVVSSSSSSVSSVSSASSTSSIDGDVRLFELADFPVGMAVSAGNEARAFLNIPEAQVTIKKHFNQITPGNIMKMSYVHPDLNRYEWGNADELVDWAQANGIGVHGHTLIWHEDYQIPGFMKWGFNGDFQAMLDEHVTTVVKHFAGKLDSWDVVNEAIDENSSTCFRNSLFYQKLGADFVANAFFAADAADPDVDLYYNDFNTEGGLQNKFDCMLQLVDNLQAKNAPIDGVGFQMHVQIDWPSTSDIRKAFQAIVDRGLKVKVTELDVPLNNPFASAPFPQYRSFTEEAQLRQKARYKAIAETYLDVVPPELRGGFTVWGIWDGESWLLDLNGRTGVADWPLLFSGPSYGPYQEKPAFFGLVEAFTGQ